MSVSHSQQFNPNPVSILIQELRHEDLQARLHSVRSLSTICVALGPDRTRNELIPFIQGEMLDDDDEVLIALSEQLGKAIDAVGGPEHACCIIPIVEDFACLEETAVRDKAVESLRKIIGAIPLETQASHITKLLDRLQNAEWFTAKMSACALLPAVWQKLGDELAMEANLVETLETLSNDSAPMSFLEVLPKDQVATQSVVEVFRKLSVDDHDSVRLFVMRNCISMTRKLPEEFDTLVRPVVEAATMDKAWRVRYMAADNFKELADAVAEGSADGIDQVREFVIPKYITLLEDQEHEVRTVATAKLVDIFRRFPEWKGWPTFRSTIETLNKLVTDQTSLVRGALATTVLELAPIFEQDLTLEHLMPIIIALLRDQVPEVRLRVLASVDKIANVVGVENFHEALLPAVVELAGDKQWRVRQAVLDHIPILAQHLGVDIFEKEMGEVYRKALQDPVFSIRDAASQRLKKLTEVLGQSWAESHVLPDLLKQKDSPNYLHRMTVLFCVKTLCEIFPRELIEEHLLPLAVSAAHDRVPNVRYNACKTLGKMRAALKPEPVNAAVQETLQRLAEDEDPDVRYLAADTLKEGGSSSSGATTNGVGPAA
ncbi:unnamed protein product [Vitrella brassicaformis CCMP3155]|uniref:Phosphatase 2A Regulatory Subunit A helical domain-containing protein n=1 Tax=Vitrella brassicaformis (strain CCMP3155) TaxID=1169540 RepID=A0A0G4EAI6_VITBC|nr:unnamed protein product [Vitrella brassicaformis CCMP3155]|eukprot:CEL92259.1 unnamed protein product [Vitrella brassicaformis CCMP3155]